MTDASCKKPAWLAPRGPSLPRPFVSLLSVMSRGGVGGRLMLGVNVGLVSVVETFDLGGAWGVGARGFWEAEKTYLLAGASWKLACQLASQANVSFMYISR